jgi:DNA-binding GntR family transcriptional regulator
MNATVFVAIDQEKLVDLAENQLLGRIIDGTLVPGQRIVEAEVARQMGISRAPLREAIRKLEARSLLVSQPRRGVFVRAYSAEDVGHVASFRLCLEKHAVENLAQSPDRTVSRRLEDLEAVYAKSFEGADAAHILESNLLFHLGLVRLAGNPRVTACFEHLSTEVRIIHSLSGAPRDAEFLNPTTYVTLVDAIRRQQLEAAAAEITRLIAGFEQKALEGLRPRGSSSLDPPPRPASARASV